MSFFTASHSLWNLFVIMTGILLAFLLLALPVLLLTRRRLWARKSPVFGEIDSKSAETDAVYPGIDPADHATAAERQAALDRLSQLPQFRLLTDGTLVEWGSGARVAPCDCSLPPVPHLMVSWGPKWKQGIVTKSGLAHYVSYQERMAAMLFAGPLDVTYFSGHKPL
ncbi:MAG: hypothetical protein M0Z99_13925 [Betaproteobacteria bacterium]|nr:hypothetical protein [Betaproteobacteria bacterium]